MSNKPNHKSKKAIVRPDQTIEARSFEGIMPDPETLAELEKLCPGCTIKWMSLAESEIKSRQVNEDRITWTFKYSTIMGQILGFISSLVICALGFYCIYTGNPVTGGVIITGNAAAVVAAFIVRNVKSKSDE